jgi:tRNA modification GTPase
MENDTVAAISTPVGSGGIGIIKISGKDALSIAANDLQTEAETFQQATKSNLIGFITAA